MSVAAAIGGAIAGAASIASTAININEARKSRRWQQEQYQHRYRYQMEDMRKAGLNPILAYQTGAPGTSGAAVARANVVSPTKGAEEGAKIPIATAQRKLLQQQVLTSAAQARQADATAANQKNMSIKALYEADLTSAQTVLQKNQIPQAKHQADFYNSKAGRPAVVMQEGGKALGTLLKRR